jgi:membrane protein YdbS with pleckstrin-like domain
MPERRLSPLALWVWRLQEVLGWGVLVVAGAIVSMAVEAAAPWAWLGPLAVLVAATAALPPLRWARWRWDVRDEGIDIQEGMVTVRRTLVPWVRVQHVDTRRGLLEQAFGLSTVVIHTAAGSHTIPLLPAADAEALRERIAGLAGTDEAEEPAVFYG